MRVKNFLNQFNILAQCRKYGLSFWQCPQILFLVMGIIIICSTLAAYIIGSHYIDDPRVMALVILSLATILFIIATVITRNFEKLAEVARMKSEFVSVVSHQLRSPLSNLKWAIELLMSGRAGLVSEKQLEFFKILKENNDRMEELISDLLTVSRVEQRTLPLKKGKFFLENLIKEVISEFKPFTTASNVKVKFEAPKRLPQVFADFSQIKLVVENLLDNAIRYIKEKGKVVIRISKKNKHLYFEIKDNGVGVPKEDQKYIFQKFFRSENILKYQTQGSGLGLYITKSIMERSGGKIGFKSTEGKGSTFWFTLPIK
jgi:signal transduction histidine kinase